MAKRATSKVTLRRQWLGRQLRELREASKLTLEAPAEFLQRTTATISRVESGIYPIRRPDVVALLDLYNVSDAKTREGLLKMSDNAWQTGWWDGYADDFDQWFVDFVWLEEQAAEHRLYDNALLPGLLQTEEYARAVNEATEQDVPPERIERLIELRMARQGLLDRDDPPVIRSIIDEAVLRRPVGGPDAMKDQLHHLVRQADRSNVMIRVLTFAGGTRACSTGAIKFYAMEEPYPDVVYVETPKGGAYIEQPDTDATAERYARIWDYALNETASVDFITGLIEET